MNKTVLGFQKAVGQLMVQLAERWRDESKYENINDYQARLQTEATKLGLTLTGMTKRPFGCTFVFERFKYTMQVKLRPTSATLQLFREPA